MVPYINPANQAPRVQTGHAQGGRELPYAYNGEKIFSETMRSRAYIFSM